MEASFLTDEEAKYESLANQGIEKHRKGDAVLTFVEPDGRPIAGARVDIKLRRHEFRFGGWPWLPRRSSHYRMSDKEARDLYDEHYVKLFNYGTAMMYWNEKNGFPRWERKQAAVDLEFIDELILWAKANEIRLKGHPLAWGKPSAVPDWIKTSSDRAKQVFLESRVRSLVAGFKGVIDEWDVVNETIWESTWANVGKKRWPVMEDIADIVDFVAPLFRWAREENPSALLLINDYGLEYDLRPGQPDFPTAVVQRKRYRAILEGMLEAGAAPDAIGLQVHEPGGAWFGPELLWSIWDEYGELGIPLHLTEVIPGHDKGTITGGFRQGEWNEELGKLAYKQFYRLGFGHPKVEALICYTTMHHGYEYEGKPNWVYEALDELINGEWQTNLTLTTDERGQIRFRGFYGEYEALLEGAEGRRIKLDYRLAKNVSSIPVYRVSRSATL